jgi:hypothetical protein
LSSTKHVPKDPGAGSALGLVQESGYIIQNPAIVVLRNGVMERLRLGALRRVACDSGKEKRQRGINGVPGSAGIGADLSAYLINGLTAESLLNHFEQ